jgi:flagellar basal-body rod protein FlgC
MDYSRSFAISAAGMSVERMRVDVAALNLANANTVQTADGASYQPLRVVARVLGAAPGTGASLVSFGAYVDQGLEDEGLAGIILPQAGIEPAGVAPRMVYEPGHPFANERGFVAYPAVDTASEMVTLMSALRAYEANLAAMNVARTLAFKALEIGGAP